MCALYSFPLRRIRRLPQLNSDTAKDFNVIPNGNLKAYLNVFKVGKELVIMGGIDVPFTWEKTYSFLTIEGLTAAKAESGMLVPVQAPGQDVTLLNIPKGGNAITINAQMPKGYYYCNCYTAIIIQSNIPAVLLIHNFRMHLDYSM